MFVFVDQMGFDADNDFLSVGDQGDEVGVGFDGFRDVGLVGD